MTKYFGTDGIRGVVNQDLTFTLAFQCGNALARQKENCKAIIGRDTRKSGDFLTLAFCTGFVSGGGNIVDVGICPTAGISYLTQYENMDYGIMISASHNPPNHNGIKIFQKNGYKIEEKFEDILETNFSKTQIEENHKLGKFIQNHSKTQKYIDFLMKKAEFSLKNKKILVDCSCGATFKIAPSIFKNLGGEVIETNCQDDGMKINQKCGSLFPENLQKEVQKHQADFGFAFDGDGDRILACDKKGTLLDGDLICYILAIHLKNKEKLAKNTLVCTEYTNTGIENSLAKQNISMIRTDVGDKYIMQKMKENDFCLGGEKAGHIILSDHLGTGDGILSAIFLLSALKENSLEEYLQDLTLFPQFSKSISVKNKNIINLPTFYSCLEKNKKEIQQKGRISIRASGTEQKIRIMVESQSEKLAKKTLNILSKQIEKLDKKIQTN